MIYWFLSHELPYIPSRYADGPLVETLRYNLSALWEPSLAQIIKDTNSLNKVAINYVLNEKRYRWTRWQIFCLASILTTFLRNWEIEGQRNYWWPQNATDETYLTDEQKKKKNHPVCSVSGSWIINIATISQTGSDLAMERYPELTQEYPEGKERHKIKHTKECIHHRARREGTNWLIKMNQLSGSKNRKQSKHRH